MDGFIYDEQVEVFFRCHAIGWSKSYGICV